MKRIEELEIILNAKTAERDVVTDTLNNIEKSYSEKINEFLKSHDVTKDWSLRTLSESHISIEFVEKRIGRNNKKYDDHIELCFSYYAHYGNDNRVLKMNTSCFGDFSLEENNYVKKYYQCVGAFCTDMNLVEEFKTILDNFISEHHSVSAELRKINSCIDNVKFEINKIKQDEIDKVTFAEQDKLFAENPNAWGVFFVQAKGVGAKHFTYRNRAVELWGNENIHDEEYKAQMAAHHLNTMNYTSNFKVIAISNIKTIK